MTLPIKISGWHPTNNLLFIKLTFLIIANLYAFLILICLNKATIIFFFYLSIDRERLVSQNINISLLSIQIKLIDDTKIETDLNGRADRELDRLIFTYEEK